MNNPSVTVQLDPGPEDNAIIYDQDTKDIVGVVIRNFSNDGGLF